MRADGVIASVDHEHGAANLVRELAHARLVGQSPRDLARDQRLGVRLERPADRVLALLGRVRLVEDLREEELEEVLVVLEPVVAVPLAPAVVGVARLDELRSALARGAAGGSGRAGAMNTMPSTRSGWCAPSSSDRSAPRESDTSVARSVPVASITARASAANSSSRYASGSGGLSDRPLPRPSNVSTRAWRAKYGI